MDYSATRCEEVASGILYMEHLPSSADICNNHGMMSSGFHAFVAVNLPEHEKIQGLIFILPLFPETTAVELWRLLDSAGAGGGCQDSSNLAAFDLRVQELLPTMPGQTGDPATAAWYQEIQRFASSITFEQ